MLTEEMNQEADTNNQTVDKLEAEGGSTKIKAVAKQVTAKQFKNDHADTYAAGVMCVRAGVALMWKSVKDMHPEVEKGGAGRTAVVVFLIQALEAIGRKWFHQTFFGGGQSKG